MYQIWKWNRVKDANVETKILHDSFLTKADEICCNLSTVLGNDGFLVTLSLLYSSWKIFDWCYTSAISLPFEYRAEQLGFSLGEPLPCLCGWQMWIVWSIWKWEDLCSLKDSCFTCIVTSFRTHFLTSCTWFPGTHVIDNVEFPYHPFCSLMKIYSLAPPPHSWSMEGRILGNHKGLRMHQRYSS